MCLSVTMASLRSIQLIVVTFVCTSIAYAGGGQSMSISSATAQGLSSATMSVTLDSTAPTEGYVVAVAYDDSQTTVSDISTAGTATESNSAELVVTEILTGGFTIGVVLDAEDPFDGHTIPAGTGQTLANITVTPGAVVTEETDVSFDFEDGTLNSPPLDNILVQSGLSVGAADGLD